MVVDSDCRDVLAHIASLVAYTFSAPAAWFSTRAGARIGAGIGLLPPERTSRDQQLPFCASVLLNSNPCGAVATLSVADITDRQFSEGDLYLLSRFAALAVAVLAGYERKDRVARASIYSAAHDFNAFLAGISGYARLAIEATAEDDPLRTYLDPLGGIAERVGAFNSRLFEISGRSDRNEMLDLQELLESSRSAFIETLGAGIQMTFAVEPGIHSVNIDPRKFVIGMLALLAELRERMPRGTVTIAVATRACTQVSPSATSVYSVMMIEATGDGAPIPVQELNLKFVSTFPATELERFADYLARSGSETKIAVQQPGSAVLEIHFPVTMQSAANAQPSPSSGTDDSADILIVDDEPEARKLCSAILQRLGYRCIAASEGREALNKLETARNVKLMITDVVMPGMDGFALISQVRERFPAMPVICTGGYDDLYVERAIASSGGKISRLMKPFTMTQLENAVISVINNRHFEDT